jgi:Tol biopolymer transport system component
MSRLFQRTLVFVVAYCWFPQPMRSAEPSLGVFSEHIDVGAVQHPGSVRFDAVAQSYEISGSGSNMWFAKDEFQFVWRKMKGDFILHARASFIDEGVDPHRKIGWMVRSSLETDSPYADATVHGDGLTSLQFRRTQGGNTEEVKSELSAPDVIQLERQGNSFTMSVAKFGESIQTTRLAELDLGDDVYVGLFVCSHRADIVERATFRNVRIVRPAKKNFRPYRDYIGSRLETVNVETGDRRVQLETAEAVQAPNWTVDGQALIYNNSGRLFRFDLTTRQLTEIDTGFANRINNDHALSVDGTMLAVSHHSADHQNKSIIFTVPVSGGTPRQVTSIGPSYLHGWSPDERFLTYTGERNGEFDIYKIPVEGGNEIRLTTSPGLDDGSEYSPDGRYIYFNSVRGGSMQIWRMRADGSEQERVTNDEFNNWFPHVSPDGRWIMFLSFSKEIPPDDHPFYQHVYLRWMSTGGGVPKVVAYVYGGQGTINVPSWSPDSRQVAFVSNSDRLD